MKTEEVQLYSSEKKALVAGVLHTALRTKDLLLIERSWAPYRASLLAALSRANIPVSSHPESLHWDWAAKARNVSLLGVSCAGVEVDNDWQGVMLARTVPYLARLKPDEGKPLVYGDYLEAAPWNWRIPEVSHSPRFKLVGTQLFSWTVQLSVNEGFQGRVGLHALPKAEPFYTGLGMTRLERDPHKEDLVYFELTARQAQQVLTKGGTP